MASLYNAHLAKNDTITVTKLIGKYRHLALTLELAFGSKSTTVAVCRPDNKHNRCRLGKNVNVRSSALEEVRH